MAVVVVATCLRCEGIVRTFTTAGLFLPYVFVVAGEGRSRTAVPQRGSTANHPIKNASLTMKLHPRVSFNFDFRKQRLRLRLKKLVLNGYDTASHLIPAPVESQVRTAFFLMQTENIPQAICDNGLCIHYHVIGLSKKVSCSEFTRKSATIWVMLQHGFAT